MNASREDARGAVLVLVLLLVVTVSSASFTVFANTSVATERAALLAERNTARAAAESGVTTARHRLRLDPCWTGGVEVIDRHAVTTTVDAWAPGNWRVVCDACPTAAGGARQRVTVELRHATPLPEVVVWREP